VKLSVVSPRSFMVTKIFDICRKEALRIRKCPDCAQLVHFDAPITVKRCRHCGATTDLSQLHISPDKQFHWLTSKADRLLPDPSALLNMSRVPLLLTLPLAIGMLLYSNSFDAQPRGAYSDRFPGFKEDLGVIDW
jgi:ribosomal protein S27E